MKAQESLTHFQPLTRGQKESLLGQKGIVVWLYGPSGAGKTTLAYAAERILHKQGHMTTVIDGEDLRRGLNKHLSFSDDDKRRNIRRAAYIARMFAQQGIITFVPAITPQSELRDLARDTVGDDYFEVYVEASAALCAQREKYSEHPGHALGEDSDPMGWDDPFEVPHNPDVVVDTQNQPVEDSVFALLEAILPHIHPEGTEN